MQVHTLDKAGLINELQIGTGISQAVLHGRRADFSLLLALFSNDVRDTTPVEHIEQVDTTDSLLRQRFELQEPQALRNDQSSYQISARQADLFHQGGLASAKLSHYLKPEALTYLLKILKIFQKRSISICQVMIAAIWHRKHRKPCCHQTYTRN